MGAPRLISPPALMKFSSKQLKMEASFPEPSTQDSPSPSLSSNLYNSDDERYLEALPSLEYLGKEPLTSDQEYSNSHIPIYPNQIYTFGRENCTCNIPDPQRRVSKRHFRIYTIVYEKNNPDVPALVYCEDFQSLNGTYVNGVLIGEMYRDKVAYLLTDGDIVEIKPSWKFRFHQPNSGFVTSQQGNTADIKHFEDVFTISQRVLGAGQFGTVYLAKDVELSTQVACKIIDLKASARQRTKDENLNGNGSKRRKRVLTSTIKQEFRKEIDILAKLSHPNIINLRKAFCSDTMMYIFTDLASGGDLFSYIDANGGHLEDLPGRLIAWQLMQAVSHMHSLGIVHRDIKTENVLIAQTDLGGRVILTDFGFANYENRATGRLTSRVGTTGFVAPEIESSRGYTKAVDLWTSGVMVAFMLTGELLVINNDSPMDDQQEAVDDFCSRMIRRPHIKPNSVDFVRKLLVPDPNSRISAPFALQHKWFTESKREAAEQAAVYKRATKYWEKREPEVNIIEDISPAIAAISPQEDPVMKRRKKLPDATSSPYFALDRHLQLPKKQPTRKQILRDLKLGGSSFVVDQDPQMITKWNKPNQKPKLFDGVMAVDGKNMFGKHETPRISESQIEAQDLTPNDADEVDLVPATRSSAERKYTKSPQDFLAKRSRTSNTSRTPLADNAPSKIGRTKTGSDNRSGKQREVKKSPVSITAKASEEMNGKAVARNGSKPGLYR